MRRPILLALPLALPALPAVAVEGNLGVLKRGDYICELPAGPSSEDWRIRKPEQDFSVISSSRYETAEGIGTYLRGGNEVRFTSGPLKGAAYRRKNDSYLRHLGPDGEPDGMRCVRKRLSDD